MTVAAVSERASELEKLCVRYHVERLDLFGSAASGGHREGASDMDFLVEFRPLPAGAYADAYFGLLEDLERLFEGPVDLVVDSAIRNPFFRQRVKETRTQIYAACGQEVPV
ncbi:MAG: nucleotidyltransferase domain-containing protein [Caldilineaceae bacterium]|nr:nucleotidyltransferase domain-containing protein [Caldilineaceae bacterium]